MLNQFSFFKIGILTQNFVVDRANALHWQGKANSLILLTKDRGVDSNQPSPVVDEGAAAVAGIDGRVRLQKLLRHNALIVEDKPLFCANDSLRNGMRQSVRIADRSNGVANFKRVAVAPLDRGHFSRFNFQNGDV